MSVHLQYSHGENVDNVLVILYTWPVVPGAQTVDKKLPVEYKTYHGTSLPAA